MSDGCSGRSAARHTSPIPAVGCQDVSGLRRAAGSRLRPRPCLAVNAPAAAARPLMLHRQGRGGVLTVDVRVRAFSPRDDARSVLRHGFPLRYAGDIATAGVRGLQGGRPRTLVRGCAMLERRARTATFGDVPGRGLTLDAVGHDWQCRSVAPFTSPGPRSEAGLLACLTGSQTVHPSRSRPGVRGVAAGGMRRDMIGMPCREEDH